MTGRECMPEIVPSRPHQRVPTLRSSRDELELPTHHHLDIDTVAKQD